mmetsp:Transcript_41759/g.101461  ORF Transcript_41759/g.101461 Transcript_41759/m.101461 type:complete len:257 (-) Transcript_41759:397-1167(-)
MRQQPEDLLHLDDRRRRLAARRALGHTRAHAVQPHRAVRAREAQLRDGAGGGHAVLELREAHPQLVGEGAPHPREGVEQRVPRQQRHHQHVLRDHPLHRARDHHAVAPRPLRIARDRVHDPRLPPEVRLGDVVPPRLLEVVDHPRVPELARGDHLVEVGGEELAHLGVLHLHHHLPPVVQPRAVNLPHRRRANGQLVEGLEHLVEASPHAPLDDPAHLRQRLGGHALLQHLELLAVLRRHDRHRRRLLAQLDEEAA